MIKKILKNVYLFFLLLSKRLGLFSLSTKFTSNGLRILCYHNFSSGTVLDWIPSLSISSKTFKRRVEYLKKANFKVVQLSESLNFLRKNRYLSNPVVVITIDDGWFTIKKNAHQILRAANFPYTVYVTSYYCVKEDPIFNLIIPFVLWRANKDNFKFNKLNFPFPLTKEALKDYRIISEKIIEYGINELSHIERCLLMQDVCIQLGIDYNGLKNEKSLSLMTLSDIKELHNDGVDIQLHTHRHKWPLDERLADIELYDNKKYLEKVAGERLEHFCYPSGIWDSRQFNYLKKHQIRSATTCQGGLNYRDTNPYTLNRYLDSEEKPQIVFEAEMSGFFEILQKLKFFHLARFVKRFVI